MEAKSTGRFAGSQWVLLRRFQKRIHARRASFNDGGRGLRFACRRPTSEDRERLLTDGAKFF